MKNLIKKAILLLAIVCITSVSGLAQITLENFQVDQAALQSDKIKYASTDGLTPFKYLVTFSRGLKAGGGYQDAYIDYQLVIKDGVQETALTKSILVNSQKFGNFNMPGYLYSNRGDSTANLQPNRKQGKVYVKYRYVNYDHPEQPWTNFIYSEAFYETINTSTAFTISGANLLCGTQTYSISHLLPGATISWNVTDGAVIVGSSTSATVQIQRGGFSNSPVLSATITSGTNVYQATPKTLSVASSGSPFLSSFKFTPDNRPGGPWKGKLIVSVNDIPGAKYNWYLDGNTRALNSIKSATFQFFPNEYHVIGVEVVSACGDVSPRLLIEYPSGTVIGGGIDDPLPPIEP